MATLKSLVDETTNIKNDIVDCYTNLKNNLIAKGAECSEDDKMSSLIDKVDELYNVYKKPEIRLFGASTYGSSSSRKKVYELDPNTLQIIKETSSPGTQPKGIGGGYDGNKLRLFGTDSDVKSLYELDPDTLSVIKTVEVSPTNNQPSGIGGGYDGNKLRLYYIDYTSKKIHELDPNTLTSMREASVEISHYEGIGGGYDGNKLRLFRTGIHTSNNVNFYEIDPDTLAVIKTVNLNQYTANNFTNGIGGGYDGNRLRLFLARQGNTYRYELDPDTLSVIKTVTTSNELNTGIGGGHYMVPHTTINNIEYKLVEV